MLDIWKLINNSKEYASFATIKEDGYIVLHKDGARIVIGISSEYIERSDDEQRSRWSDQ
jgi:hypothetical protein